MTKNKQDLPTVMAKVIVGTKQKPNDKGGHDTTYIQGMREVEVLTVHFNKGTMRVRFMDDGMFGKPPKVRIENISNAAFIEQYQVKRVD
jgi:hypothetical protein